MISLPDFEKKQIVVIFFNDGEKLSFSNENLVVKNKDGKIKLQCSCYRVFLVFAVGGFSVTSAIIDKASKFNFFIALMTAGFRLIELLGKGKDGNTLLKKTQYDYNKLDIAKHIIKNKIGNQMSLIKGIREKNELCKKTLESLKQYQMQVKEVKLLQELLAYEGLAAKVYFKQFFANNDWIGRVPRMKVDYINSTMDIGYNLLFIFIEVILLSHGFDIYCGVLHRQFYMRKSLVCDIMEPFRTIIDKQIKKSLNLHQFIKDDFEIINNQYKLNWKNNSDYVNIFLSAIMKNKRNIFSYIQQYYRCFIKGKGAVDFPVFEMIV